MTLGPIYCQKCKRANSAAAEKCIWCGVKIVAGEGPALVDKTNIDIDYLSGVDGFSEQGTVRLEVSRSGLTVTGATGGRSTVIPAASVVGVRVVDASYTVAGGRTRASWKWWLAIGPLALLLPGKRKPDVTKTDYILTIKYKTGEQVRSAVFHREDRLALSLLEGLARIITSLVQSQVQ